ncbi:hypothetical protein [Ureibacillus acetophenoni]|uniref:Uncharacterized protein n=1 Tax=Ureibacillus acetophenoni TaxID=614649 RepID=A0A285U562_9BACL|nr:hypothetical protein [Ureibacillus acetophenoni]SOC37080.1 hypothetical protein SAMN05877842_10311 [Ureibacillus acetophenoni]
MTIIKCAIDTKNAFSNKPSSNLIKEIQTSALQGQREYSIKQLAEYVVKGYSFCPSLFKEVDGKLSRSKVKWAGTQLIGLDFDDGISLDEFKAIGEEYGLKPNFIYYTFNHGVEGKEKFRVVYMLNAFITDIRIYNYIQKSLSVIFDNKQDPQAKDVSRLFFGGRGLATEIDESAMLKIELLSQMVYTKLKKTCTNQFSREMRKFCQETAINQINKKGPAIFVENMLTSINNNIEVSTNSTTFHPVSINTVTNNRITFNFSITQEELIRTPIDKKPKKYVIDNITNKMKAEQRVDLENLKTRCQLVNALENGEWLYHDEITHIAMNLIHARGGQKKLIDSLELNENHITTNKVEDFKYYCQYFSNHNYQPSSCNPRGKCSTGCRFFDQCERNGKNILQQLDVKKGKIKRVASLPTVPLSDGEYQLQAAYNEFLDAPIDGSIHVIKAPTGIGKSKLYTSHSLKNCAIAVPNHRLAKEIYQSIKGTQPELDVVYISEKPSTTPMLDQEILQSHQLGLYNRANQLFNSFTQDIISGKKQPESEEHKNAIIKYSQSITKAYSASTVILTHERMMHPPAMKNINTFIIDEDIIPSVIKTSNINITDLEVLLASQNESIESFIDSVKSTSNETYTDTPKLELKHGVFTKCIQNNSAQLTSNIINFIHSTHYIKHDNGIIDFVQNRSNFPTDKKYIMFSATTSRTIGKSIWGERVTFHDIGETETKGSVILHYDRSYSRASMSNLDIKLFVKKLKEQNEENTKVITFKKYAKSLENEGIDIAATFGATMGLNQFSGEDLIIVGTPHFPPSKYLLTALTLNRIKIDESNGLQINPTLVKRNGFEFHFTTFPDNKILRDIQFYFIESELIQSIGRARLLRNDANVNLYSNFPVPNCILELEQN